MYVLINIGFGPESKIISPSIQAWSQDLHQKFESTMGNNLDGHWSLNR